MEEDEERVKIVTLRVGARVKEGKGGRGRGEKILAPLSPLNFEFQHGAFTSKTFARPKKTPAL